MPGRSTLPAPEGRGTRPWLIAAIIVLSLALIAMLWFGVRPMLTGGPASPRTTGSTATTPTSPGNFGPMSWSAPLTIPDADKLPAWPADASQLPFRASIWESGVDGIDLIGMAHDGGVFDAQAVDSSTMQVLWNSSGRLLYGGPDGLVIQTGQDHFANVLDPRTGNIVGHQLSGYYNLVVGGGMVVTDDHSDPNNVVVCGRRITAPDNCVWTRTGPGLWVLPVFGGGTWVDLGTEVVDVATGKPATFGQRPAPNDPNYPPCDQFGGPAKDRILLGLCDPRTTQLWNTQTDSAIGQPLDLGALLYNTELPNYMILADDGTLTAYSWQTAQQQWRTKLASGIGLGQIYGNTVLVSGNAITSTVGVWAVDATTGEITDHIPTPGYLSGIAGGVAYLTDGSTLTAVDATTLAPLGSIAYPEAGAWVRVVDGHVAAMSQSGRYYVMQT